MFIRHDCACQIIIIIENTARLEKSAGNADRYTMMYRGTAIITVFTDCDNNQNNNNINCCVVVVYRTTFINYVYKNYYLLLFVLRERMPN